MTVGRLLSAPFFSTPGGKKRPPWSHLGEGMRLLELFSGTGSVGKAFEERGWSTTSLDVDPASEPDFCCDILSFDFRQFQPGTFEAIWASPPCTEYSIARTKAKRPRNFELADSLVRRALEIIEYLRPKVWWIENPATGLLKSRDVVAGLGFSLVDYCRFGAPYRKRTILFTNVSMDNVLCGRTCEALKQSGGRNHPLSAQRGPIIVGGSRRRDDDCHLDQLHALPRDLCLHVERVTREKIESEK